MSSAAKQCVACRASQPSIANVVHCLMLCLCCCNNMGYRGNMGYISHMQQYGLLGNMVWARRNHIGSFVHTLPALQLVQMMLPSMAAAPHHYALLDRLSHRLLAHAQAV